MQTNKIELVEHYRSADFILLDEVEKAHMKEGSDYVPKKTEDLVRYVTTQGKVLIMSSNLEEAEIEEIFGDSTMSAIKRHLKVVAVAGDDFSETMQDGWMEKLKTSFDYHHENIVTAANERALNEDK
jgi:ATP-dependent Clp protease ATP-binding subunit ClpA